MLHGVLARQLRKVGIEPAEIGTRWRALLGRVSQAYVDADQERYRLERSIAICSQEMSELNSNLAAEGDRLKTIVTSMGDALCVLDAGRRLTFANRAAEAILGAPAADLVGRPLVAFLDETPGGAGLLGPGNVRADDGCRIVAVSGEKIDVSISIATLDSACGGSVVIFRDIRERKRAEDALRASEERFRAFFESAAVGIARTSLEGVILECNEVYAKMIGLSRGELVGRCWYEFVPEDERPTVMEKAAEQRRTTTPLVLERRYLHRDGGTVWGAVSVSAVRDAAGAPIFNIVVVRDITAQRHLEITLRHAQRLESVGRLAAGIAHEINTPIQFVGDNLHFLQTSFDGILGMYARLRALVPAEREAEVAALEADGDLAYLAGEFPRGVSQSLEGTSHVAKIVQAMRVFAHNERSEDQVRVDLNATLQSVVTVAGNETKYVADVELAAGEAPPILAFPSDLNQVFLNLIVNAAHAVADAVKGSGARGKIRLRTAREGDSVVVTVEDTGAGIPEAIHGKIFDPFFTTKEVGRGTGQGLALARSIVEGKHGGSITFESAVGLGTTFRVRLPISGRARPSATEAA